MTLVNNPERLRADLRASECADAIGLNYRHSRARLWLILREGVVEPEPNDKLKELFAYGNWAEPFTDSVYKDLFKPIVLLRGITLFRKLHNFTIAASPDAIDEEFVIEYKSKSRGSELPITPNAKHVIQVVVQMWAARRERGRLFYHNLWTGQWVCFHLHWNQHAWDDHVSKWLLEFLNKPPSRMKNGEPQRRADILLKAFWFDESRPSQDQREVGQD